MQTRSETQELHFLFEEPGRRTGEGFVVFCSDCECVLRASSGYSETGRVVESLLNRCPGCGSQLERSVAGRMMPLSEKWADVEPQSRTPRQQRKNRVVFRPASSLRGFRSGLARLDCLVEPLEPGRLAVLRGWPSGPLSEMLSFRAQLPLESGGLDSHVVFIDGGNRSDLYLFSRVAAAAGAVPKRALRRVVTSRAFTVYQLADLISHGLPRAVEDYGAKLVVVSDALSMFSDPSISLVEAKRVVSAICSGLSRTRGPDRLVVVTLSGPTVHDASLDALADIVLEFRREGSAVRANLLKHPKRRQGSVALPLEAFGSETAVTSRHGANRTFVQDGAGR